VQGHEVTFADLAARDAVVTGHFAKLDDPFSYADTLALLLYTRAHAVGHRVVLDGVEGDIVHSVPGDLASTLMRTGQLRAALALLRGDGAPWHRAGRRLLAAGLPGRMLEARRRKRRRRAVERALAVSALRLRAATRAMLVDRYAAHLEHRDRPFADPRMQHATWIDLPFITSALERYDRAAARCGVEVRHPLLDRRLVEFSLSLPWHLKRRGGESKWLLRRAAAELPAEVLNRRDHPHLGWAFTTAWAGAHWARMRAGVAHSEQAWSPYLRKDRVMQMFRSERYNAETARPLQLHHLTQWLERFE
jgi:asparagine synthase (glutamine-hydrolysing)